MDKTLDLWNFQTLDETSASYSKKTEEEEEEA